MNVIPVALKGLLYKLLTYKLKDSFSMAYQLKLMLYMDLNGTQYILYLRIIGSDGQLP
jgi:hypothetical protein